MAVRNNPKLHKTIWFWLALISPIFIGIGLATTIILNSPDMQLGLSNIQINKTISDLKLPIGITGLALPFVALVASVHRSSQTAHQIEVQTEQNSFANHFKHLEEFSKAITSNIPRPWESPADFHSFIYPNTLSGSITPDQALYSSIDAERMLLKYLEECEQNPIGIPALTTAYYYETLQILGIKEPIAYIHSMDLSPNCLLNLFQAINNAVSFSGVHAKPYNLNPYLSDPFKELNHINSGYRYYKANIHIFIRELKTPEEHQSGLAALHENSPIKSDYTQLALVQAWLTSPNVEHLEKEKLSPHSFEEWQSIIEGVRNKPLKYFSEYWNGNYLKYTSD